LQDKGFRLSKSLKSFKNFKSPTAHEKTCGKLKKTMKKLKPDKKAKATHQQRKKFCDKS
jgi:hypothetical protein